MARNKLTDLNDHLFAQLERLGDEDLTTDEVQTEVQRAKAITGLASQIINNARVTLDAVKMVNDGETMRKQLPDYIGIDNHKIDTK